MGKKLKKKASEKWQKEDEKRREAFSLKKVK